MSFSFVLSPLIICVEVTTQTVDEVYTLTADEVTFSPLSTRIDLTIDYPAEMDGSKLTWTKITLYNQENDQVQTDFCMQHILIKCIDKESEAKTGEHSPSIPSPSFVYHKRERMLRKKKTCLGFY